MYRLLCSLRRDGGALTHLTDEDKELWSYLSMIMLIRGNCICCCCWDFMYDIVIAVVVAAGREREREIVFGRRRASSSANVSIATNNSPRIMLNNQNFARGFTEVCRCINGIIRLRTRPTLWYNVVSNAFSTSGFSVQFISTSFVEHYPPG